MEAPAAPLTLADELALSDELDVTDTEDDLRLKLFEIQSSDFLLFNAGGAIPYDPAVELLELLSTERPGAILDDDDESLTCVSPLRFRMRWSSCCQVKPAISFRVFPRAGQPSCLFDAGNARSTAAEALAGSYTRPAQSIRYDMCFEGSQRLASLYELAEDILARFSRTSFKARKTSTPNRKVNDRNAPRVLHVCKCHARCSLSYIQALQSYELEVRLKSQKRNKRLPVPRRSANNTGYTSVLVGQQTGPDSIIDCTPCCFRTVRQP